YNGTNAYTGLLTIAASGAGMYSDYTIIQSSGVAMDLSGITNITGTQESYSNQGRTYIYNSGQAITLNFTTGNTILGALSTTNGAITLTNSSGSINTAGLTTTNAGITVTAAGNVQTHAVNAGTAGTAPVAITAGGNILVGYLVSNAYYQSAVTGSSITLKSRSGGGSTGYVYTGALTTGGGDITIGGGSGAISGGSGYAIGTGTQYQHYGVWIKGGVTAAGGNVIINGQGGSYSGGTNSGILLETNGASSASISTSGTGTISIYGTGGSSGNGNRGILITSDYGCGDNTCTASYNIVSTGSGAITISGTGGSGSSNWGLRFYADSSSNPMRIGYNGTNSYSGVITIAANSMELNGTNEYNITTTNDIVVKTTTSGGTIGVGTGSGTLALSSTYLGYLNWGSSAKLVIGDTTNTGVIDINHTSTWSKAVHFVNKSGSNITLSGNITSSAAGDAVVIAAGGNFVNSTSRTISLTNVGTKRWVIYSTQASNDTAGGLSADQLIYSNTYDTLAPSSIIPATYSDSENTWVYNSVGGSITFTANNISRDYGDANPTLTYSFSCSTGCTEGQAVASGSLSLSAAGGTTTSAAGSTFAINISQGSLTLGGAYAAYTLNFVNGTLTVDQAALTITGSSATKTYGSTVSFNGASDFTPTGLKNGETIGSVTLAQNGGTGASANVGSYTNTPSAATGGTFTASNYDITYVAGTITVNPAAITVTAASTSKTYGDTTNFAGTEFTVSGGDGLQNSETLTGVTLTSAGAASSAGAGSYNITPSAASGANGFNASNYNITYTNGTLTVNKKALTVTAADASRAYGSADPSFSATFDGFVNGDDANDLSGSASFTTNATSTSAFGTSHYIRPTIGTLSSSNYSFDTFVDGTLTISKYALTITAADQNKTYGDTFTFDGDEFTTSGLQNGETIGSITLTSSGAASGANATTYAITGSSATGGTFDIDNYDITYAAGTLTVGAKDITLTADDISREYGVANGTLTYSCSTLVGSDTCTGIFSSGPSLTTLADITSNVADGPFAINISGGTLANGNYNITGYTGGVLTITRASLTVSGDDVSRSYGSVNPSLSYTVTGLRNSDTAGSTLSGLGVSTAATQSSNAGDYDITTTATLTSNNYNLTVENGTLTVTPAVLTATANNKSRTYGSSNPSFDGTITGFVLGQLENDIVTSGPTYSSAATSASNAGTHAITGSGGTLANGNYVFAYADGTLTVNKATLTVTANNTSKTFASVNPSFTSTITGFVNSDTASVIDSAPTYSTAATQYSDVGTYAITAASASDNNYNFTYVAGTLTIDRASLIITATNNSKTYGQSITLNGSSDFTVSGLQSGESIDSVTLSSSGTGTGANVGSYSITPSAAIGTYNSGNYTLAYVPGTLTVNPATVNVTANNLTKTYGAADPTLTYSYSGLVNGDTGSVFSGALSRAAGNNVGSYNITVGTLAASNYTINLTAGRTLTIDPAALTITATSRSKGYATTLAASGSEFTSSGLQYSDTVGSVSFASAGAVDSADVGSYTLTPSAATGGSFSASNYTISYASGTLTVIPSVLNISADSFSRVYGDANPTFTGTVSGLLSGDSITVSYSSAATQASNVGAYDINAALSGTDAGNYTLSNTPGTLTITKANLTVTGQNTSRVYGTSNSINVGFSGFKNSDTSSVVSGTAGVSTAATAGSDIGTYAITPTVGSLSATNYNFVGFAPATLTITPASMVVTASDMTRTYGDANPTWTGTLVGKYSGDTITATYTSSATQQSNVGSYSITTASLYDPSNRLGNYNVTYQSGTLTINPATLIASGANLYKRQGEANPALALSLTGLKSWDDASVFSGYTLSTTVEMMTPKGYYAINLSGGSASNYTVTRYAGVFTVDGPYIPTSVVNPVVPDVPAPSTSSGNTSSNSNSSGSNNSSNASGNSNSANAPAGNNGNSNGSNNPNSGDSASDTSAIGSLGSSDGLVSLSGDCSADDQGRLGKCRKILYTISNKVRLGGLNPSANSPTI
ncbi:MAG: MBG domain-containing protein, partial [Alphaproteobacteria bacterium]|nr:MBG domain-containing protein [Alphaproteobacteria bacterium]